MTWQQNRWRWSCVVVWLMSCAGVGVKAQDANSLSTSPAALLKTVQSDYEQMYLSGPRWLRLGAAFGAGAVMANTHIDQGVRDWYQDHQRTSNTDHVSDVAKEFGEGAIMIPVSLGAGFLGDRLGLSQSGSSISQWGTRTARAYLAGAPMLLVTQWATGGDRPIAGDSQWRPFAHDHGVSGHAFIGGVPFITAGRMIEDNPLARYALYAVSTLPAWSRINDDKHYASQAFLGWFLAWEATDAILQTDKKDQHVSLGPMMTADACGLALVIEW